MDLSVKKIKRIVAFDFDDTLAVTDSLIGIATSLPLDLPATLEEAGISYREKSGEFLWIDSCNYEKLESLNATEKFGIRFDYCQTLSLNVQSAKPIVPMIEAMREALSDPFTKVILVTARAGYSKVWSESLGYDVLASNRQKITEFLGIHDITVLDDDLHTVGDVAEAGGDTATAKAEVLSTYAKTYPAAEIVFYDDSERNLKAASGLQKHQGVKNRVTVHRVKHGVVVETKTFRHKIGIKQRLSSIFKCMLE